MKFLLNDTRNLVCFGFSEKTHKWGRIVVEDSVKDKVKNNIVLRDYDKLVFFNSSKGKKPICSWWETLLLSHVKCHLNSKPKPNDKKAKLNSCDCYNNY
jgi:hypothetical protein